MFIKPHHLVLKNHLAFVTWSLKILRVCLCSGYGWTNGSEVHVCGTSAGTCVAACGITTLKLYTEAGGEHSNGGVLQIVTYSWPCFIHHPFSSQVLILTAAVVFHLVKGQENCAEFEHAGPHTPNE